LLTILLTNVLLFVLLHLHISAIVLNVLPLALLTFTQIPLLDFVLCLRVAQITPGEIPQAKLVSQPALTTIIQTKDHQLRCACRCVPQVTMLTILPKVV
jgi:hypothetical protein